MKSKTYLIITILSLLSIQVAESQDVRNFPFDPFVILKSWNYDFLIKTMGKGEEITGTMKNQTYLAGLKYPADLLGMHGNLEFTFNKDSISRFQFRKEHKASVTSADLAGGKMRDPAVNSEYNRAIQKLDSLQKMDSISRDSVVRAISEILGPPVSNGRTAVTEKNARHSAVWINRGYTCLYKDYINYSEIVFSLSTIPLWAVGEFGIPAGTEIIQKTLVNTRKMSWTASLLGLPLDAGRMIYSDILLLLEFAAGQRYLESVPKNAINYLPRLIFEDCDGDGIPEAWLQVPSDKDGIQTRHFLFSLPFKEPNLIFSSDDLIPVSISIQNGSRIIITLQDETTRVLESQGPVAKLNQTVQLNPKGFKYLRSTKLNTDGSTNFIGGIELRTSPETPGFGILEISYKHTAGGWETDQISLLRNDR